MPLMFAQSGAQAIIKGGPAGRRCHMERCLPACSALPCNAVRRSLHLGAVCSGPSCSLLCEGWFQIDD